MIHQITIRNFKSLSDVTVDLSPVTVFVGKSGSGKSNFVSAIDFLRRWLVPQERQVLPQRFQNVESFVFALTPDRPIEFIVEFDVVGYEHSFTYLLRLRPKEWQSWPAAEMLKYGDDIVFEQQRDGHNQPRWTTEPRVIPPISPGEAALGRLPSVDSVADAYSALTAGIGIYRFPFDVLLTNGRSGQSKPSQLGLNDDAENFLDILATITRSAATRQQVDAVTRLVNLTIESVRLDSIQNPQFAIVGHKIDDRTLSLKLNQESDGFRRFFAHILALYQSTTKQTLVFEEPENGIFPGALAVLAEEFNAAPDAGRGQVLLTTHSPRLLDYFSAGQIRVVELVNFETKIGPLADDQRQAIEDKLLFPGELLVEDPARRKVAN